MNKQDNNEEIIDERYNEENIEEYRKSKFVYYEEFIRMYPNYIKFDPNLPKDIKITTMTLIITYPIEFNIKNIADNIILSNNFIVSIKYGNSTSYYRTIKKENKKKQYTKKLTKKLTKNLTQKQIKDNKNEEENKDEEMKEIKIKERKRKNFYNHVSLEIENKKENIKLNIKIFQNQSLQITGLKKLSWLFWALYNIFNYIKYKTKEITFGTPINNFHINKMEKFYIVMMNCIFNVGFNINLIKLYNIIKNDYEIQFDTGKHCALNISYKFKLNENKFCNVSVIIYNNGKILMSAKENYEVIMKCYKDISLLLLNYYNDIVLETYVINDNLSEQSDDEDNIKEDYDENNNEEDEDEDEYIEE